MMAQRPLMWCEQLMTVDGRPAWVLDTSDYSIKTRSIMIIKQNTQQTHTLKLFGCYCTSSNVDFLESCNCGTEMGFSLIVFLIFAATIQRTFLDTGIYTCKASSATFHYL